MPDKIKNKNVLNVIFERFSISPEIKTIIQLKIRTTTVRIAVAREELIFLIPIFARTAVIPAKNAERNAAGIHILTHFLFYKVKKGDDF